jgi:SAM-dependent MidA family methyltransferase
MKMPDSAIRAEIQKHGVIPFARFMELALYHPETGYYESQKNTVGRRGDFITSVSTGELFGQLLAFQFGEWLQNLNQFKIKNETLKIIEAGAHDGKLAADILNWLKIHRPEMFAEIEYCLIEPSAQRQQWQRETLKEFPNVRWLNLQPSTFNLQLTGIFFSNELLDAFPVHRLGWDAKNKKWFEWGVTIQNEQFVWKRLENSEFRIQNSELETVLPDNYTIEICPAAENWWRDAAKILAHGKLLAIDYGFTAAEQFSPSRTKGTLRAYHQHRVSDDLLANVGEQDLTAHVNFSAIQKAGEAAGLQTEDFCTQPQFLTRIFSAAVKQNQFTPLTAKQVRQFQTLTHPEHLGRAFRVLVQAAGAMTEGHL